MPNSFAGPKSRLRHLVVALTVLLILVEVGARHLTLAGEGAAGVSSMDTIEAVAVSPDGQWVGGGGGDTQVRLWNARTGALGRTFRGHDTEVVAVAFAPDGKTLASGSADHVVILWDVSTGARLRTLKGKARSRLNGLAFAHDGSTIAVADQLGRVTLWSAKLGEVAREWEGAELPVNAVAFSPNDKIVAGGCGDRTVKLWDARTGELRHTLAHGGIVRALAFLSDKELITACEDGGVRLWDPEAAVLRLVLAEDSLPVRAVAASPDGRLVAAVGEGSLEPRIWEGTSGNRLDLKATSPAPLRSLAFSPDSRVLVSGGGAKSIGTLEAWNLQTGTALWNVSGHLQRVVSIRFSPDGTMIAGGIDGYRTVKDSFVEFGQIGIWTASTGERLPLLAEPELHNLSGTGNWVQALAFAPDGKTVAVGRADHTIQVWDLRTGRVRQTCQGPDAVITLAFASDGKTLASGHQGSTQRGGELILWDATTGKSMWRQVVPRSSVMVVAFSPDGGSLASSSLRHQHSSGASSEIRLWNTRTGAPKATMKGEIRSTGALAFSRDGAMMAAAFRDGTVRLWDVPTGAPRWALKGHSPGWTLAVAFSLDGKTIASASLRDRIQLERPGEVKFWDTATGALRRTVKVDGEPASSVVFSPEITTLAIGRDDGTMTRMNLTDETEPKQAGVLRCLLPMTLTILVDENRNTVIHRRGFVFPPLQSKTPARSRDRSSCGE